MTRPTKDSLHANAEYLKEWADFQRDFQTTGPILLPISLSIEDGVIARDRIKSDDLAKVRPHLEADFEVLCSDPDSNFSDFYCLEDFTKILDEYITEFESDGSQGPRPPSPLDFNITRPVWFMFYLPRENWAFSDNIQYSMENDQDDFARNCEKVCTLRDNRVLILANHCRSEPDHLKYNLHVTISQEERGDILKTDIIIDPGMNNDTRHPPGGLGGGGG